jgi:formylglycine-generating enzyme required for sulfatase activity
VIQGNELREYATLTGRLSKAEAHYDAGTTADVGSYPRLSNGLGDMCGNVWKWMQNWYGSYSKDAVTDPAGPASGEVKSVRGGSWRSSDFPEVLRAAVRFDGYTGGRYDFFGFRVAAPQDSGKAL